VLKVVGLLHPFEHVDQQSSNIVGPTMLDNVLMFGHFEAKKLQLNLFGDTSQIIHPRAVDGFVFSYLRFSACYEDRNTTIRFRNKRFN
jgi:hypothetical protein